MSAYEELVERCDTAWLIGGVEGVLAEVLRTLENVTPEMLEAASMNTSTQMIAKAVWLAMLPASPLSSP